ncbi:hypothetical protein Mal64_26280 [Pseudobythopirellula maris]|uniref:Oligosaccharide repeat unit polymerase n=1 Tax=Pseudobythopirellula maris TaxID=2527991 RepID=A0A5C5ZIA6_9BACT|nr:hypothetical protein [Pseudobythopirellula maris]TWT87094.1 hypothetical protein Mal64_26280 [Pseudobythopirellula maris]
MLYLGCTLTLSLCAALVAVRAKDLQGRFGEVVFFLSYGLVFGLAPMMQSESAYVNVFSYSSRVEAAWYAFAGVVALAIGFSAYRTPTPLLAARRKHLLRQIADSRTQRMLEKLFWASIAATAGAQLLMMYSKGISLSDILNAGRFAYRFENQGVLSVLSLHLSSFAYVPAFIGVFLNRRYQLLTLAYIPLASLAFFLVFSKGTRSIPLAMVATLLVASSIRYRFSAKRAAQIALLGFVSLALAIGLFELRHYPGASFTKSVAILLTPSTYDGMWDRDPLSYSANIVGAIDTFPDSYPYLNGASYRRMPVFFLKESRFPDIKPPDTNIVFGLVVHSRPEDLQVTVPPSILGDVFINFWGWFGIPVLVLHGMLYCWLLQSMQCRFWAAMWVGPLSGRFLVLVHRGEPYEMFVLFIMFFFEMAFLRSVCQAFSPAIRTHLVKAAPPAPHQGSASRKPKRRSSIA